MLQAEAVALAAAAAERVRQAAAHEARLARQRLAEEARMLAGAEGSECLLEHRCAICFDRP